MRNQSLNFFTIVYEILKSIISLSNSVQMYLVIGSHFWTKNVCAKTKVNHYEWNFMAHIYTSLIFCWSKKVGFSTSFLDSLSVLSLVWHFRFFRGFNPNSMKGNFSGVVAKIIYHKYVLQTQGSCSSQPFGPIKNGLVSGRLACIK